MFYKAKGTKTLYKKFIYAVATVAALATVAVIILISSISPKVKVSAAEKVKLVSKTAKLLIGETTKIKVKNVPDGAKITYKSNKTKVATVDKDGTVAALTAGSAKIVVSVEADGKTSKLSFIVTVRKPAPKKKKPTVSVGDKVDIPFKYLPADGYAYTIDITSKKPEVAGTTEGEGKISGISSDMLKDGVLSGILEAKSVGTAKVSVTVKAGKKSYTATVKITVKADTDSLTDIKEQLKNAGTQNIVTFGHYEQDNDLTNGKEPIEWIVLSNDGEKALLLSKYGLDSKPYNVGYEAVTWENCTLRSWLNTEFYDNAFSNSEKKEIKLAHLENKDNPDFGTPGGNDTEDNIFLLSFDDVKNIDYGFDDPWIKDIKRRCAPTTVAVVNGCSQAYDVYENYITSDGIYTCWWWLRSPGGVFGGVSHEYVYPGEVYAHDLKYEACDVYFDGYVNDLGFFVGSDGGAVRPALYINLES